VEWSLGKVDNGRIRHGCGGNYLEHKQGHPDG